MTKQYDADRYEHIKARGKAAEMFVQGALRGGYFDGHTFTFHRGTTIMFQDTHPSHVHIHKTA